MKLYIFFFLIFLIPIIGFSSETEISCIINEELENNMPAKKELFTGKEIKFYLDNEEGWLYEKKKMEWELLNQEKRNMISKSLIENTENFLFIKKIYNTEKKKNLQSIDKVILFKQKLEMIFIKEYYNNHIKYFTTEIRGICK
ncbi:MAG: hypothetical protein ACJ0G0_05970 [Alphaproteobacteria bacterium]|tara:strand:+ start:2704 stop:3132 length:429 start_codon:yes stop_codon:yes gene_type:complete